MHSLGIVQWNSTRRDHPGNLGGVSGSGPVMWEVNCLEKPFLPHVIRRCLNCLVQPKPSNLNNSCCSTLVRS